MLTSNVDQLPSFPIQVPLVENEIGEGDGFPRRKRGILYLIQEDDVAVS